MAFVTTTSPDLYATTSNLEEIPAGADVLQYCDDDKMNQILVGLTALHGWASGVPVSETANGHFLALASGASAAVSVAAGVRIRQNAGALDYSYNTGAYARLLSKLTLASQATGDIMYASAVDTWTRLAAGTNGHVLTLAAGVPTWAAGGGGGGIADSDNVVWTGTHSFEGVSFNVNPLATFAAGINLTGTLAVTGGATVSTTLGLAAGSAAAPSLYQTGDTNTGIYFPAGDQFAITTAGTARLVIDGSTELHSLIQTGPGGSASLPTYGFTGDANTGWYSEGADQLNASLGGTQRYKIGTTYARWALNGGVYADTSAFEVVTGGAGADGRGRFQNTSSATGVGGGVSANDSGGGATWLLDGTSTTRSGVAGGTFFVGLSSGAHFGALTNTDSHWITGNADSTADRVASAVYNAGNRYLNIGYFYQLTEMSAPATPDANKARIFLRDVGGFTTLSIIWPSGVIDNIATDPGP